MQGMVGLALLAYLLGSIPSAYLVTRLATGKDIRREGDGNMGARNVAHVVGPGAGLLTFVMDVSKGAAAGAIARPWIDGRVNVCVAALALLLGHGFPIWMGGRGGKGLAAEAGFLLALWPLDTALALFVLAISWRFLMGFETATALAAVALVGLRVWRSGDIWDSAFAACFLGLSALKKVIDMPYERKLQSDTGSDREPS